MEYIMKTFKTKVSHNKIAIKLSVQSQTAFYSYIPSAHLKNSCFLKDLGGEELNLSCTPLSTSMIKNNFI